MFNRRVKNVSKQGGVRQKRGGEKIGAARDMTLKETMDTDII